jgi:hypothetical protein
VKLRRTHERASPGAILGRPSMPHTDLLAPSAQSLGHVSEGAERAADLIYDPRHDKGGLLGVKRLRRVARATRALEQQSTNRYVHRKAAGKRRAKQGRFVSH